jgi:hypothetical protein
MTAPAQLYSFMIQQAIVAKNNLDGTFGTPYTLQSTKTVTVDATQVSDRAEGNAQITALASQAIEHKLTLDTAGFDQSALAIFLPVSPASSNGGSNWDEGNVRSLYFGMIAQVWPDVGDVLHFWPKCKVMSGFKYKLEYGKIIVPQFTCEAILDSNQGYMFRERERPNATPSTAINFPPNFA